MSLFDVDVPATARGPITFEILGLPAPQGSKSRMPNGAIVEGKSAEQRRRHGSWRDSIAAAARDIASQVEGAPLEGPIALSVEFRFPMPASRRKAVREAGRCPKVSAPDLDKLVRTLGDALQAGGLIRDDARISVLRDVTKVEVIGWTGAIVTIGADA